MNDLTKEELKNLLLRCWMTHDAMWLKNAYAEGGSELANKLNKAAIRDMGPIEIKRLLKAIGLESVRSAKDCETLLQGAYRTLMGDFMGFNWSWPEPDRLRVTFPTCFAFDGMTKMGAIDHYQCGIFERVYSWFDALGLSYEATPKIDGCMMHEQGKCHRDIVFQF
ncbi:MAG: hypothetical protein OQJ97_03080 [Rhodospirillales bacterium]|nr:hypothetical protein [Rhodospirillales bacterium]